MAGDDTSVPSGAGEGAVWRPHRAVMAMGKGIVTLNAFCFSAIAMIIQSVIRPWFPSFFITLAVLAVAIFVHEAGHYVAARRGGMAVIVMRAGPLQIAPKRRGWRVRLKRIPGAAAGAVLALPNPNQPWRPAFIRFALGGVAANLLLVVVLVIAMIFAPSVHARLWLAACLCGAAWPLVNIVPFHRGMDSDGLIALRWWRHPPEGKQLLAVRALSRVMWGAPLDTLTPDETTALRGMSSMHAVWYDLMRDLLRGDWESGSGRLDAWKAAIPADARMRALLSEFTGHVRREIAFAAAIHHRDASLLPDKTALRASRWGNPDLAPRCRAVVAWLDDDFNALTVATVEAMAKAVDSTDRSAQETVRRICAALAATPRQPM